MVMNDPMADVTGARTAAADGGQLGRRALFRSMRRPATAAALAVGLASSGALRALPAAAIEFCDGDPIIFVDVNGVRTGVKVILGWIKSATSIVDHRATNNSVVATVKQGKHGVATITVSATVVAGQSGLPTRLQLALVAPNATPTAWSYGSTNSAMTNSISVAV